MAGEEIKKVSMRDPFPPHQISLLPKPTIKREEYAKLPKATCKECGGYHATSKTIHLSYVGHAALTDRLLDVDPAWSWEPLAFTPDGLPRFDATGGLWIRLTVNGITRLGYGNAKGNDYADIGSREKEVIGDALRNAAMRFGAALELWHKGVLHMEDDIESEKKEATKITPDPVDEQKIFTSVVWFKEMIDADQIEENWRKVQAGYAKLSSNECMAVDAQLKDKAPNSNKSYRNLLKEYLDYRPKEGVM